MRSASTAAKFSKSGKLRRRKDPASTSRFPTRDFPTPWHQKPPTTLARKTETGIVQGFRFSAIVPCESKGLVLSERDTSASYTGSARATKGSCRQIESVLPVARRAISFAKGSSALDVTTAPASPRGVL